MDSSDPVARRFCLLSGKLVAMGIVKQPEFLQKHEVIGKGSFGKVYKGYVNTLSCMPFIFLGWIVGVGGKWRSK